ncbi:MAG TPA: hypothetical protein QF401_05830 [Candidatus Poseidoniaceae archaeon]|nr:hypothetical protein [Candidatus Poseidoniaceae archaeon]
MLKNQRSTRDVQRSSCTAFVLVFLMLGVPLSAGNDATFAASLLPEPEQDTTGELFFHPGENQSSVNTSLSSTISVPSNQTFLSGTLDVEPLWNTSSSNGTQFGVGASHQWNGTHQLTNGIGHGGKLTLATNSSLGSITNFESSVVVAPGWMGTGADHEAWSIQRPSLVPFTTNSGMLVPSNGSNSIGFLATQARGDLGPDMEGCLRSPTIETPTFVKNYTLTFEHWTALLTDDAAWIEIRHTNGTWGLLSPLDGYPSTAQLNHSPSTVWNGEDSNWATSQFQLDPYVTDMQATVQFRLCFQTSSSLGARGGWFVDNFEVHNQGDDSASWFHGNLSGNYLANAHGDLVLPLNLSNFTGQNVELEIWVNWDIQGGASDYLTAWLSLDNGSTYSPISTYPGHPSMGAVCGGVWFNGGDSLGEWCPVRYSLPWTMTAPQNASHALVRFNVETNAQINYGGTTSMGWEGITIDDLSVWTDRGTPSQYIQRLKNFTNQPTGINGSSDGWLETPAGPNEWQWITLLGHNTQKTTLIDFDSGNELPAGWSLWAQSNRRWEVGPTSNSSGFGPGLWHSGTNGAGIYLDDEYRSDMWTDLYTPEYTLPENSTSRLTFRSWICTESNWDGGTVSISTDGGDSWWFIPPTFGSFHDQLSTVNSFSPFHNQGIFDGSTVVGGCHNVQRGFDLKEYDLSNLTGLSVRAKFSFFSDQLIELDGWYIDDAGIEIDVYEPAGTWVSEVLTPDPLFGWGQLDGFVFEPENTSVRFDILDGNGTPIDGYQNKTLPLDLPFDTLQFPTLHVRVNLTSLDRLVTPYIERLSVGTLTFFDSYHLSHLGDYGGSNLQVLEVNSDTAIVSTATTNLASLIWSTNALCPFQKAEFQMIGGNLTATHSQYSVVSSRWDDAYRPSLIQTIERQGRPQLSTDFSLTWYPGQSLSGFLFEPICGTAPLQPVIELGLEDTELFSWPESNASQEFGLNRNFNSLEIFDSNIVHGTQSIEFTYSSGTTLANLTILVARSLGTGPVVSSFDVSFLIAAQTDGGSSWVRYAPFSQGQSFDATSSTQFRRVQTTGTCHSQTQHTAHLDACVFQLQLNGNFTAKLTQLQFIPHHQTLTTQLTHQTLNSILQDTYNASPSPILDIPMKVQTVEGSVMVNLSYATQTKLVDRIVPPTHTRWLPTQTIVFETQHWRGDAHSLEWDAPDFSSIHLTLSSSASYADSLVEVEAFNLDSSPQYRQLYGVGFASFIENQSSTVCTMNTCTVTWAFNSHWLMDDVDDLYILAKGVDVDGFSTGPTILHRHTLFNEIENDLEVIDFNVIDDTNRVLSDWSNPQWPFHLNASQNMQASGKVRFEGILDAYVGLGDAQVRIDATAVPPVNQSGGPDEWPDEPIIWNMSWYADVDANGAFLVPINAPDINENIPSNTRIVLSPHLERLGPASENAATSIDQTSLSQAIPFLFDKIEPTTTTLQILDSGGYAPADGYIWTLQQDVALRLILQDPEGLSNTIQFSYWLEASHDMNDNGEMEEEEYSTQTVTFNSGLTSAEIDLPHLSWQDILPAGRSLGKASIVVKGFDLAGNALLGGGEFGEQNDLATLQVQERFDTLIETESLSFDLYNSSLLIGNEHTFSFALTDANGIQSLDSIELALLSQDQSEICAIKYLPRFEQIIYDSNCFEISPIVHVSKTPLQAEWHLDITFRIAWGVDNISTLSGTPSLKVFDEGQNLGLGLSHLSVFNWHLSSELYLGPIIISDQTEPIGVITATEISVHLNDDILVETQLYHANTSISAQHIPSSAYIQATLSDGERSILQNMSFSSTGNISMLLNLNSSILKHRQATLTVEVIGVPNMIFFQSFDITLDQDNPLLSIPPGILSQVDYDTFDEQEIIVIVSDEVGMDINSVKMHWYFTRAGIEIDNSAGEQSIDYLSGTAPTYTFSSRVNLQPSNESLLLKNDQLVVWFSGFDMSGRAISGFGTEGQPLNPRFQWIAFEPQFEDIIVTPYRPVLGEQLSIFVRVSNVGVLTGNMTVECYDDLGRLLASNSSTIGGGSWVDYEWKVEAWKTGRLGITVKIVNFTGNVPIPVADVQTYQQQDGQTATKLGFAGLIFLLSSGIFIASILHRREKINEFTSNQVHHAMDYRSMPPPRPKDLVDLTQEE